jgi:hypothetical protein
MRVLLMAFVVIALSATSATAGTRHPEANIAGSLQPRGVFAEHVKTHVHVRGKRFQAQWTSTFVDSLESGISGWPLTGVLEDDPAEWYAYFGLDLSVFGFVCITEVEPSAWCYHRVFLGPIPTQIYLNWFNNNVAPTYIQAAALIMTMVHEANHYRLVSADEGRVNACALQQFPGVLGQYFQIYPTISKTVPVKKTVWKWKWVWVHRHGKRVKVRRHVRRVVTTYVQRTFQNPDYVNLVGASIAFYQSQPPPYNTGTCY